MSLRQVLYDLMLFTHLVERKVGEEQKGGKVLETVCDGKGAGMAAYTGLGGGSLCFGK